MKNVKNKYVDISHICIFLFNKEKQMIVENQYLEDIKKIWEENKIFPLEIFDDTEYLGK